MTERILRFVRRRRGTATCLFSLVLAVPAAMLTVAHVERDGRSFYRTGKATVDLLARLADALEAGDPRELAAVYAPAFAGEPLALLHPVLEDDRDGVLVHRFRVPEGRVSRDGAVEGWMRYHAGFESIDEVGLHVHRIEDRDGPETVATVRFELIGTPEGASRAAIDRALFRMRFRTGENGRPRVAAAELVEGERVSAERPRFAEVGEAVGIAFENRHYPPFLTEPLAFGMIRYGPAGITAADFDNDGLHDLFIPDGVASRLYRNRGDGSFEDVTEAAGLAGLSGVSVALFADYDDDGWKDLFVSRTFEPNQLFRSNGRGPDGRVTFTDVTAASGLGADCCTTVASWGDYDNDGDLDLYVGRYLDPRTAIPTTFYARNGEPNRLYRNEGDGTFTDVTLEAGVGDTGLCLGSAFGDYDGDGWLDIWVANDFGRKTLYRNRGPDPQGGPDGVRFDDVTVESGTLAYGAGMSSTFGDYDNDGDLDLYVAHIRSEHAWYAGSPTVYRYMLNSFRQGVWRSDMPLYWEIFRQSGTRFVEVFQQMASGNTLLRNEGDGGFEDVTWEAGANPPGWFWGTSFADFDNDGWLDLYAANGWVYGEPGTEIELEFLNSVVSRQDIYKTGALFDPDRFEGRSWHGWERNRHLRNERDGTFREIGRAAGTDLLLNSRGIAVADFWNRGVLDLAVAASEDRHALLANRPDDGRRWLAVEVVGAGRDLPDGTNRDGVGARITVRAGGLTQMREVVLGDGYGSQNSLRQHFGLGGALKIDELTVTWPRSGRVEAFHDLAPDRIVRVVEGRDELEEPAYPAV
ncbi:MAG TPA: CRTAC1 family protein, partial [Thermoanaerobaculia bacterium]|nr:CRTAC1 family protein [Thermoanaerobaculia bacterium]